MIPLPAALVAMAFDEEHEVIVALTDDGQVHRIDPATGEVLQSTPVLDTIELPDGHGGPPVPTVLVAGDRAYVTDPDGGRVVELGIADELRVAREIAVGGNPAGVAVVGLAPTTHD
ncbi:YncE family protein [Actinomarinicola tropica]|uniref:YncE family protein n=1 Tax=Actinomarinicola tropica TaxID=2789776 RepID=UPI00189B9308|nr:hypothetical protein [Actinomarinicola tropica]